MNEPTEQELDQAKEVVIAQLAWAFMISKETQIESVKQFTKIHDEFCRNSASKMEEVMKTEQSTQEYLHRLQQVWESGVDYLLRFHNKLAELDRQIMTLGLRTMKFHLNALRGNLAMIRSPKLRKRIENMNPNPA